MSDLQLLLQAKKNVSSTCWNYWRSPILHRKISISERLRSVNLIIGNEQKREKIKTFLNKICTTVFIFSQNTEFLHNFLLLVKFKSRNSVVKFPLVWLNQLHPPLGIEQTLTKNLVQGSALGPLLFNIYLNDLFFLSKFTDLCNFADDTNFYASHMDINSLIKRLEYDSFLVIEWFENNNMKLNQDYKCHFLISGYKDENVWANIGNKKIWESNK